MNGSSQFRDVFGDVISSRANQPRTWVRRGILLLVASMVVVSALGLFERSAVKVLTVKDQNYEVSFQPFVRGGTQTLVALEMSDQRLPADRLTLCVANSLMDVFDQYDVIPAPVSISSCREGIEIAFDRHRLQGQSEILISGTVSENSSSHLEGGISLEIDGQRDSSTVNVWRMP